MEVSFNPFIKLDNQIDIIDNFMLIYDNKSYHIKHKIVSTNWYHHFRVALPEIVTVLFYYPKNELIDNH